MNKKALSPLVATAILVAFSLIVGTVTMNWGKSYVDTMETVEEPEIKTGTIIINYNDVDTDLKNLQIKHLTGQLTQEEYIIQEKELLKE